MSLRSPSEEYRPPSPVLGLATAMALSSPTGSYPMMLEANESNVNYVFTDLESSKAYVVDGPESIRQTPFMANLTMAEGWQLMEPRESYQMSNNPMTTYPTPLLDTMDMLDYSTTDAQRSEAVMRPSPLTLETADLASSPSSKRGRPTSKSSKTMTKSRSKTKSSSSSSSSASSSFKNEQPAQDDDVRRHRRRERNKIAATKCRNKKKLRTQLLMKESEGLEGENDRLLGEIQRLESEKQQLMDVLALHEPNCARRLQEEMEAAEAALEEYNEDDEEHVIKPFRLASFQTISALAKSIRAVVTNNTSNMESSNNVGNTDNLLPTFFPSDNREVEGGQQQQQSGLPQSYLMA